MNESPSRFKLYLAFACVYVIWGSTYLAIRVAVETIPPFLMLASRFVPAGILMIAWLVWRGTPLPSAREWRGAGIVGSMLLMGGTGAVAWAEQWIDSGLAALIISVSPLWFALFEWMGPDGRRPSGKTLLGIILGFGGIVWLIGPAALVSVGSAESSLGQAAEGAGPGLELLGTVAVLAGAFSWAAGSVWGRHLKQPDSLWMRAAAQMLVGGTALALIGIATGEWDAIRMEAVSRRSLTALSYLLVFGSLVAFGAYVFLLEHVSPTKVSSYAYVNPVVAIVLGWLLADEVLTLRAGLAAGVILLGVVLIVQGRARHANVLEAHSTQTEQPTSG